MRALFIGILLAALGAAAVYATICMGDEPAMGAP